MHSLRLATQLKAGKSRCIMFTYMSSAGISQQLKKVPVGVRSFVQILVDTFVLCSPLALYDDLEEYSVLAVGLVVFFYCGLNNLAKIFLGESNISISLLCEGQGATC